MEIRGPEHRAVRTVLSLVAIGSVVTAGLIDRGEHNTHLRATQAAAAAQPEFNTMALAGEQIWDLPTTTTTTEVPTTITTIDADTARRTDKTHVSRGVARTHIPTTATTSVTHPPVAHAISGDKAEWMSEAGIDQSDWGYVDGIITPESHWNPGEVYGSCWGLGQNCADDKGRHWLSEACPDWPNQPVCQLERFTVYAVNRYGSWAKAYQFRRTHRWW